MYVKFKSMPKLIALIKKQPHLSAAAFKAYYEKNHAPLVSLLLPMVQRYTRSYLPASSALPGRGDADFDVITELWFATTQDVDAFWKRIRSPEVIAQIRADEAHFLITERTLMYEVQECESRLLEK